MIVRTVLTRVRVVHEHTNSYRRLTIHEFRLGLYVCRCFAYLTWVIYVLCIALLVVMGLNVLSTSDCIICMEDLCLK